MERCLEGPPGTPQRHSFGGLNDLHQFYRRLPKVGMLYYPVNLVEDPMMSRSVVVSTKVSRRFFVADARYRSGLGRIPSATTLHEGLMGKSYSRMGRMFCGSVRDMDV